jgi:hypothetical protein
MMKLLKILIAGGLGLLMAPAVNAEVIPTTVWTSFYGGSTTYNGGPVPAGSRIDAYSESGLHCGTFVVKTTGQYGLMSVYGDDGYGDGCVFGETVTFYINGRLAVPQGPDDPVWNGQGARNEVDLAASSNVVDMDPIMMPDDHTARPGDTVRYYITVMNSGDGGDFYSVSAASEHGWKIKPMLGTVYAFPFECATVYFDLFIPTAIFYAIDDETSFKVSSGVDASVFIEGTVITHVEIPTDVNDEDDGLLPNRFELYQNYPNPFNPGTIIPFSLPNSATVELEIFDILGRRVDAIDLGKMSAGIHAIDYNAGALASGVYFYRVKAGEQQKVRKMLLMK